WYWPFGLLYLAYCFCSFASFFIHNAVSPVLYILSLHDALPIFSRAGRPGRLLLWLPAGLLAGGMRPAWLRPRSPALREGWRAARSEEHTSELQSRFEFVCLLLLEKKKIDIYFSVFCCLFECVVI